MSYTKQLQNNHSSLDNSIALIDCNNFYASCERIFNPKLMRKPIVVLSNNDGCIITRSAEAKKLGIKMGEPYFKAKKIINKNNVKVFSSNYSLYGDISQRVMETLARFAPDIEIYSIDEAFLGLNGFENYELSTYCHHIRHTIKQWVGIPVSIGVSSTKTLSKIANNLAKKNKEYDGVCILKSWFEINEALKLTPIGDVWGIGRRLSSFLQKYNINTAYDFIQLDKGWVRKNMGVVGEKTFLELCGVSCIELDLITSDKKSCCVSRSFSKPIEKIYDLEESVSVYGTRVAEKIREEGLMAESMSVFVLTNYFNRKEKQYSNSIKLQLPFPTNNSIKIVKRALQGIRKIYREGYRYKKAGVILYGLSKSSHVKGLLDYDRESSDMIMNTMDRINGRYGSSTIRLASEGIEKSWRMRRENVSPCYTTNFDDLVKVKT
ncbi:Y-family DNA polymerase [Pelagibacterales bacterium SAG-MED31]|nr:Y-family DNA polymerase [Pelagibacterales bacterium SAG-MED31]